MRTCWEQKKLSSHHSQVTSTEKHPRLTNFPNTDCINTFSKGITKRHLLRPPKEKNATELCTLICGEREKELLTREIIGTWAFKKVVKKNTFLETAC